MNNFFMAVLWLQLYYLSWQLKWVIHMLLTEIIIKNWSQQKKGERCAPGGVLISLNFLVKGFKKIRKNVDVIYGWSLNINILCLTRLLLTLHKELNWEHAMFKSSMDGLAKRNSFTESIKRQKFLQREAITWWIT